MSENYIFNSLNKNHLKGNGDHILYVFNDVDKYIKNAVNFIQDGIEKNEVILFVDTEEVTNKVKGDLLGKGYNLHKLQHLIFADSQQTYICNGDQFNLDKTEGLINLLKPYFEEGHSIRTWGQVLVPDHESTLEKLRIFECNSDDFIAESNLLSVCAYNGLTIPAYIQNELMRTHTHFMTDNEYILSPLYDRKHLEMPSVEEKERLRRIAMQNKELKHRNNRLAEENKLINLENKIIRESEQKLRAIIEQLPIPIIIRRNTKVLFLNDIAQEQFAIENCNIKEKNYLLHFFENYDKYSVSSEIDKDQQNQFSLSNGKKKHYLVKSIELLFEGEPSVFHAFVDITQEKENESLIVRSEKMNIAGELAASIAHELRNPLTAIKGFFYMMKDAGNDKEMYYSVIDDELSRIEQISSELLSLAKPHSDNRRTHDIVQLIDEVKLLLTSQANSKSIEITLQAAKNEMYLSCEATKIKQVFINLVKNAIEATDSGGNIILKINEIEDNIEVQVIDEGNGIPKELMNKIGEPFYTTKEKGTGIGLMVCYRIIENHKGTISVDSEVGVGTIFRITLPALRKKLNV